MELLKILVCANSLFVSCDQIAQKVPTCMNSGFAAQVMIAQTGLMDDQHHMIVSCRKFRVAQNE